jgi:ABC-type nitrate/sulfonate/bicarbonate transport system substrate-binding protein
MNRRGLLRGGMLASGLMLGAPLLAACGGDNNAAPAKAAPAKAAPAKAGTLGAGSLRLFWVKDVEFGGSYIADTNGYYKAAGFSSFELIAGGPTATPVETDLVGGKALFGISAPDLVASAVVQGGAGVKIIGAQFQKNPFAMLSMAGKPIKTPQDMIGKKIGVQASIESTWAAFLKANHINPQSITKVPVQYDPLPLTTGTVDGWVAYITNEPVALRLKGFKVETFLFADHGYPLVGDVYVVTDKTIRERPDAVKAFLRAQIRGWKEALADPALGARLTVGKYGKNLGLNVAEQTLESEAQNSLLLTDDVKKNGLFTITPELIAENIATLKLAGINVTAEQLFDPSVLTAVYQEDPTLV